MSFVAVETSKFIWKTGVKLPEQLAAAHIGPDTQPVDHLAVGLDLAVATSTGSPFYIS